MQKPIVHLNGTSRESLVLQFHKASLALQAAIDTVGDAAPHARDYYPIGGAVYAHAAKEHAARMRALTEVRAEIVELLEHVYGV